MADTFANFTPTPGDRPGVYTQTVSESNVANLLGGIRVPIMIGVGQEEILQSDQELVRGSSASIDQQIVNEDVSVSWVVDASNPSNLVLGGQNGSRVQFKVRNYPIVDGSGIGLTTNNTSKVSVSVNGVPTAVGSVNGAAGLVTLQVPTQPEDLVLVTYFFHRGDTAFTDDLSAQVTVDDAYLISPGYEPYAIVAGSNDQFSFTKNGVDHAMTFLPGSLTASNLKAQIDAQLFPNLIVSVFTDNQGLKHLKLTTTQSLVIGSGSANGPLGWTANTKTDRNRSFRVFNRPVVDGSGGGLTTTDTSKVVVKVNGSQVVPASVDGTNGIVTLPFSPSKGSVVVVSYWANTWQDTFDYIPFSPVSSVVRCGIAPARSDYILGQDFVVSNPTSDTSIIHWGTSYDISPTKVTPGATPMTESQIVGSLVDDKLYLALAAPVVDTSTLPAKTSRLEFLLPEIPTMGNGRSTPLGSDLFAAVTNSRYDLVSNRPDLVIAYAGRTLKDAVSRDPVQVVAVDGVNRKLTLQTAVAPDYKLWVTFNYSRIVDDSYTFTCLVPGAVGTGQYTIFSALKNSLLSQVRFGTKSALTQTVQWPRGVETVPDAFHAGSGVPVNEVVTVTFTVNPATNATFTSDGAEPYGFYSPYSSTLPITLNGTAYSANLATAAPAFLVGSHVVPIQTGIDAGKITVAVAPANVLHLLIDGIEQAATGLITTVAGALLVDGETFTVDDGVNPPVVFEFDDNASVTVGNVQVPFTALDTATQVRDAIIASVNGVGATLSVTASIFAINQVRLTNDDSGDQGNVPLESTVADPGFVVVGMSGGDGKISIPITAGNRFPAQIVADVNAAIDSYEPFTATAPNGLFGFVQIGPSTGDVIFYCQGLEVPAALPAGFDSQSIVQILQGTVETTLGFSTYQKALGTTGAIVKPATLLGSKAGPFSIVAGVNDLFKYQVDNIEYAVTLPAGGAVTTAAIVAAIGLVSPSVASAGTGVNLNKLRLTSTTNGASSQLLILDGNANSTLGFSEGDSAGRGLVSVQEVVDVLMDTPLILGDGIAYPETITGSVYLTVESITVGAATSSISFPVAGNSALNPTTGLGITEVVDGDIGEDATDGFDVTSSNPSGSSGSGYPGQTYTDEITGLRFSVLPAATGSYDTNGSFTMEVSTAFKVDPSRPYLAIGGMELHVANTVGVGVGDTSTLTTYNPGGLEPAIGDYYYLTYNVGKTDFSPRLYRQTKTIIAEYGESNPENRVTLAAQLAISNGALLVGIKQVKKAPNTNQGTDAAFIAAIDDLRAPLPGGIKPDLLVPLATTTAVYSKLSQHVVQMCTWRAQSERMGFIGFASGTTPTAAGAIAKSLRTQELVAFYPDTGVITFEDALGQTYEALVDGSFFAAAVAGSSVSPALDVATPYARRRIRGFTRIPRILDDVVAGQVASSGITVLENTPTDIRVWRGFTTDMTSILTQLPTAIQIQHHIQQQSRAVLESFVGTKLLASRANEIAVAMVALFTQKVKEQIVGKFSTPVVESDPNSPVIMRYENSYTPIFPLLFILLQFNLRVRL